MLQDPSFDVMVVVLSSPDDANHHFWKFMDPQHPSYDAKEGGRFGHIPLELYKKCDEAVGRMLAHVDDDTLVIVMSDHGGGPSPTHRFNINYWLRSQGLLSVKQKRLSGFSAALGDALYTLKEHLPYKEHIRRLLPVGALSTLSSTLMNIANVDWPRTKAYRVPMYAATDGIEVNLLGRQPEGVVRPGEEYEELRHSIIKQLLDTFGPHGGGVVKAVHRKEEIFSGPFVDDAPDLVVKLHEDYAGGISLKPPVISPVPRAFLDVWSGAHRMNGILIAQGRNVQVGVALDDASIMDLAPTILYAMGIPVPSDMDGKVLLDIFEPAFVKQSEIRYATPVAERQSPKSGLTEEEEKEMVAKLRGMGYL
jgi:predicted AlkP superfamily phosphohydrolase/phosphomutase